MIRAATEGDLPDLLDMCEDFHKHSGLQAPVERHTLSMSLMGFMANEEVLLLVSGPPGAVTGTICALAYPVWFNRTITEVTELFWWVRPEHRGKGAGMALLAEMLAWAIKKGAMLAQVGSIEAMHRRGLDRAYGKMGFVPKERFYIKRLQ